MKVGDTLKSGSFRWVIVGLFDAAGQRLRVGDLDRRRRTCSSRPSATSTPRSSCACPTPDPPRRFIETIKGDQRLKLEGKTERKYYDEQMITGAPIKALAFIVGIFTAIGAAFGAMNTMYAQVSARTREIGTLRAIGFSRRSILASFVIEALMLCLAGGVLGVVFTFLVFNLFLTKPTGTMNFRTFSEVLFNFRMTPPLDRRRPRLRPRDGRPRRLLSRVARGPAEDHDGAAGSLTVASAALRVCAFGAPARGSPVGSTAGLTLRFALAPAARRSSLGYFGRLAAPRADVAAWRNRKRIAKSGPLDPGDCF